DDLAQRGELRPLRFQISDGRLLALVALAQLAEAGRLLPRPLGLLLDALRHRFSPRPWRRFVGRNRGDPPGSSPPSFPTTARCLPRLGQPKVIGRPLDPLGALSFSSVCRSLSTR